MRTAFVMRCIIAACLLSAGAASGRELHETLSYHNDKYHFRLDYPANYLLNEAADTIDFSSPQHWLTLEIHEVQELAATCTLVYGYADCGALAGVERYRARLHCDADSMDATAYCLDADVTMQPVTIGGRAGYQFQMVRTLEDYASRAKTREKFAQLLYYLDLSSGGTLRFLEIYADDSAATRAILQSLKFD